VLMHPKGQQPNRAMAIPAPDTATDSARSCDRSREPPRPQRVPQLSIQAPALRPARTLASHSPAADPSFRRPWLHRKHPAHTPGQIQSLQGRSSAAPTRPCKCFKRELPSPFGPKTATRDSASAAGSPITTLLTAWHPPPSRWSTPRLATIGPERSLVTIRS